MSTGTSIGNNSFMNKWGLSIKAAGYTGVLLIVRLVFESLNYDVLSLTNLITAFISGAICTIAIIFAGVLTDFKESEKIPGELATSIRTMYSDLTLIHVPDKDITRRMQAGSVPSLKPLTRISGTMHGTRKRWIRPSVHLSKISPVSLT